MKDAAIGVFDSGMGGLTVMRALMAGMPSESFVYLGDTARLPYGTKGADTVTRYAVQAVSALVKRKIKLLVVACNTASGVALPALNEAFAPLPVIDVIAPGAEAALAASPQGPIAVIATEGTVRAGAYERAIRARAPKVPVLQQACPLLVPLAEEGLIEGAIVDLAIHRYLDSLLERAPAALVLGCTHYPVLRDAIARIAGPDIVLVDSAATVALAVERRLAQDGLLREGPPMPHRFLATDAAKRFARIGEIFLGQRI
ncbi:MAG: glutamate racemase, partial [Alphaproteobacteria bacterium]|nr:glutamate racemase [Alphaproteobacteria bacterium]